VLLIIALLACGGDKTPTEIHDADGDGYDSPEDCNDHDATVNPNVGEICNGVDDDCDGEVDDHPTDGTVFHKDADGDGYGDPLITSVACEQPTGWVTNPDDCADDDGGTHPGADELCNGNDDNCDGSIDEDPVDAPTWYADADGDGQGDPALSAVACDAPDTYVSNQQDCDDSRSDVFTGAPEHCDGMDEDCNGAIDNDPVDGSTWYADADGDHFGDEHLPQVACEAPLDTIGTGGDCDDQDADAWPGAPELCGDGQVNDCLATPDDAAATCGGWGDPVSADTAARDLLLASAASGLGATLAGAGDVDGNGLDDVLIGAFHDPTGGSQAGQVQLVRSMSTAGGTSVQTVEGAAGDELGSEVAALGDVDGDGAAEYLLAATMSGDRAQGRVYLMRGGPGVPDLSSARATWEGDGDGEIAGTEALAALGDIDGDHVPDFLVGARYGSLGDTYAGQAYVVSGASTGTHSLADATARLYGTASFGLAGSRVAGPGDLDGDGLPDVVMDGSGDAAWILFGPVVGDIDAQADADLRILDSGALTLSDVAGADLDGDGHADLVLSSATESTGGDRAGGVFVHLGPWTADVELTAGNLSILGEEADANLGGEVAILEDVDGDGQPDLLVGEGLSTIRAGSLPVIGTGGEVLVYSGVGHRGGTLLQHQADLRLTSSAASFGADVASAGDLDDDGRTDLLIGAPSATGGGGAGGAWIIPSDVRY